MNKIRERFDAFVKEHGCEPRYAECDVIFADDKSNRVGMFTISFVQDEETYENDDLIFYYCDSLSDLIALTEGFGGGDNFMVVADSVSFTNNLY